MGLGSFGLGRLSTRDQGGLNIGYPKEEAQIPTSEVLGANTSEVLPKNEVKPAPKPKVATEPVPSVYFASNRGNKYYHLGCTGGKTLKPENKIYFNTEQEAISAGYEKSASCK